MNIAIIGRGGHSKVIQDLLRQKEEYRIAAYLDDKYDQLTYDNVLYTGPISAASQLVERVENMRFVVAVGNNEVREAIVSRVGLSNDHYISLINETAVISPRASIGLGTVIMAHAIVNADAEIGHHAIVNSGAIVEHDCLIQDFVHLAPRVTLTGSVVIEEGSFLGAAAVVIPGKRVGRWSVIGAGTTVIHDTPPNSTVVGNPARIIKNHNNKEQANAGNPGSEKNLSLQSPHERQGKAIYGRSF